MPKYSNVVKDIALESQCGMGWKLELEIFEDGNGRISLSNLHEIHCEEGDEEGEAQVEVIERLVLAHACAGVDVETNSYAAGIDTVLEALANDS